MVIERLTECIGRAVHHAQFRSVYGNWFESSVMRKFYARKMRREYCLSNTDAINVRETELTGLVSELTPMVVRYCSPETGAVGNGLYTLMGSVASPRLPSVEDYAKILVLAAAHWMILNESRVCLRAGLKADPSESGCVPCSRE